MKKRILLFDIDGTLLNSKGAGRRALERAIVHCAGAGPWLEFPLNGMTDLSIVEKALRSKGKEFSLALCEKVFEVYGVFLEEEFQEVEELEILPEVVNTLDAAAASKSLVSGVATGNCEKGAVEKLKKARLLDFFSFFAYGSESPSRAVVLQRGMERGAALLSSPLEFCDTLVIGDTPKDVAAAHAVGASCLAVATGGHDRESLQRAGADRVVDDLSSAAVLQYILGG